MRTKITLLLFLFSLVVDSQTQIGNDINGESAGDVFGRTVSLSSDGNVLAIGAPNNDGANGSNSGHVRVYTNIAGTWTQIGDDIEGESGSDSSGFALSLSSDGNVVAIGAHQNDGNGFNSGHVRIFRNTGGSWVQIGNDIDGEAAVDLFGFSVSLSEDGGFLAVGAPNNNGAAGSNTGHVRVYQNISETWTQIGDDIDGEAINDQSGFSIDISSNGEIVAIGAPGNDGTAIGAGHVRVFQNISGIWTQIGDDIDSNPGDITFGESVSLSSNGMIVALGSPNADGIGVDSGVVRVFQNISGTWTQIGSDISGEVAQDESGHKDSISLSSDGSIIAIGARFNDDSAGAAGHVRIFQNISGTWTQIGADIDGTMNDQSGFSVDLSSSGTTVAISSPFNSNATGGGEVKVYDLANTLSVNTFTSSILSFYPNPVSSLFTIKSNGPISKVSIFSLVGQNVGEVKGGGANSLQLDVSQFVSGHYFVKVKIEDKIENIRLVID